MKVTAKWRFKAQCFLQIGSTVVILNGDAFGGKVRRALLLGAPLPHLKK